MSKKIIIIVGVIISCIVLLGMESEEEFKVTEEVSYDVHRALDDYAQMIHEQRALSISMGREAISDEVDVNNAIEKLIGQIGYEGIEGKDLVWILISEQRPEVIKKYHQLMKDEVITVREYRLELHPLLTISDDNIFKKQIDKM